MVKSRDTIRIVVQELLNDVIEQGFHHLVNHPQQSDELNHIIQDATEELNYQLLKIDSHSFKLDKEIEQHYERISSDTQRKSLDLLSKLQKIQIIDNPRLKRV